MVDIPNVPDKNPKIGAFMNNTPEVILRFRQVLSVQFLNFLRFQTLIYVAPQLGLLDWEIGSVSAFSSKFKGQSALFKQKESVIVLS